MTTLGPDPAPLYTETLIAHGYDPAQFFIGQVGLVYLANSEDQAWTEVQEHLFHSMEYYGKILSEANDAPGGKDIWRFKSPTEVHNSGFGRAALIGTPEQIARKMEKVLQHRRCTHFVISVQVPGLDPRKVTRSLELFAKEGMPSFRQEGGFYGFEQTRNSWFPRRVHWRRDQPVRAENRTVRIQYPVGSRSHGTGDFLALFVPVEPD